MVSLKVLLIFVLCGLTSAHLRGLTAQSGLPDSGNWYVNVPVMGRSPILGGMIGDSYYFGEWSSQKGYAVNVNSGEISTTEPDIFSVSSLPGYGSGSWVLFQTDIVEGNSAFGFMASGASIDASSSFAMEGQCRVIFALSIQSALCLGDPNGVYQVSLGTQNASKWDISGGELIDIASFEREGQGFTALFVIGSTHSVIGKFNSFGFIPTLYSVENVTFFSALNVNGQTVLVGSEASSGSSRTKIVLGIVDFESESIDTVSVFSDYGDNIQVVACNGGIYLYDGENIFFYTEDLQFVNSWKMTFGSQTYLNNSNLQCAPDSTRLTFGLQVTVDSKFYNQLLVLDLQNASSLGSSFTGLNVVPAGTAYGPSQTFTMAVNNEIQIEVSQISLVESNLSAQVQYTQVGSVSAVSQENIVIPEGSNVDA